MRTLGIAAFVAATAAAGCHKDPLREDMQMFCRAVDVVHESTHVPMNGPGRISLVQIGPWIAERAKTPELLALLATVKDGQTTIHEFLATAEALAKQANVEPCRTIIVLSKPQQP
jgi:hypothetical protein